MTATEPRFRVGQTVRAMGKRGTVTELRRNRVYVLIDGEARAYPYDHNEVKESA